MTLPKDFQVDPALDASRDVLGFMLDALIDDLHRHDGYRTMPPRRDVRPRRD